MLERASKVPCPPLEGNPTPSATKRSRNQNERYGWREALSVSYFPVNYLVLSQKQSLSVIIYRPMEEHIDPRELMLRAKTGDYEAFSALYRCYFVPIFRFVYLRIKNRDEAEDITQTVFLKVYEKIGSFEDRGFSPIAYFIRVARTTIIDWMRKRRELILLDDPLSGIPEQESEEKNPQEAISDREQAETLESVLATLREEDRELIILRHMAGLSYRDISQATGRTEQAVRQAVSRTIRGLRKELMNNDFFDLHT